MTFTCRNEIGLFAAMAFLQSGNIKKAGCYDLASVASPGEKATVGGRWSKRLCRPLVMLTIRARATLAARPAKSSIGASSGCARVSGEGMPYLILAREAVSKAMARIDSIYIAEGSDRNYELVRRGTCMKSTPEIGRPKRAHRAQMSAMPKMLWPPDEAALLVWPATRKVSCRR